MTPQMNVGSTENVILDKHGGVTFLRVAVSDTTPYVHRVNMFKVQFHECRAQAN